MCKAIIAAIADATADNELIKFTRSMFKTCLQLLIIKQYHYI